METGYQFKEKNENLEDITQDLFKTSSSGSGEEELLKTASGYALQLTAPQIRILLYLEQLAEILPERPAKLLKDFVFRYIELKRNNNSDMYVMRALDSISLRKFINENSFKVNIDK